MPGNVLLNEKWHMIIQGMDQPTLHIPEVGRPSAAPHVSFVEKTAGRVELVGVKHKEITNVWAMILSLSSASASNLGKTKHRVILFGDNPRWVMCMPQIEWLKGTVEGI
jgi:hypothetical protein